MTDEALRDLVLKHDSTIGNLTMSVEALVKSNSETNSRLEEISRYLAKQAVFDTKLSGMDKELADSFKRVHKRIDGLEETQTSNSGCRSVQLLSRDTNSLTKDVDRIIQALSDTDEDLKTLSKIVDAIPSPKVMMWVSGLVILYLVSFGSFVVSSMHSNEVNITKIAEHISQ